MASASALELCGQINHPLLLFITFGAAELLEEHHTNLITVVAVRLLRNRVSAQQARERKKAYLSDLEVRSKELEHRNAELEERVSTLQRENQMLRQVYIVITKKHHLFVRN